MSTTDPGSKHDDGKSWVITHPADAKSGKKLASQVRCSMPKRAICDLEIEVNWWLEENDQCR